LFDAGIKVETTIVQGRIVYSALEAGVFQ
jgi:hypothetical protein